MHKALFGAIALAVSTASSVMAADMPMSYKAAPATAAAYSWTGCYIGAHSGGGRGANEQGLLLGLPLDTVHSSGWFGGVQGGCDYQIGSVVVGVEGQFDWADIKGTATTIPPALLFIRSLTSSIVSPPQQGASAMLSTVC